MSTSSKISDPQETAAAMHPAAAGEVPAATESEAPITTQVLAADNVCQPLAFAVFACAGKGVSVDNPQFDENYSAIGAEDTFSSTTSIASSIFKFREGNGRTYNSYGDRTYFMPNDEIERDRLDLQHHLWQLTFGGKIFTAPIDRTKLHRVLDAGTGTGTGIWAIDMGDLYPETGVYGVDVSPIQPQFMPPNVIFEIDDLEKRWTFTKGFEFVFSRMMTGSFSDWKQYIERCFAHEPCGYLEVQDVCLPVRCDDNTLKGTNLEKFGELLLEGSLKLGVGLDVALTTKQLMELMEEAGFVDGVQVIYKWPLNMWPANKTMEIGLWVHEATSSSLAGFVAIFTNGQMLGKILRTPGFMPTGLSMLFMEENPINAGPRVRRATRKARRLVLRWR